MSIFFLIKEGLSNLFRARLAALISVVSISLSLTLLTIFTITGENVKGLFEQAYQQIEIEAFLFPNQSQAQIKSLQEKISAMSAIASVKYISPGQALKDFQESFGEDFSSIVTENPLPASLRITLKPGDNSPLMVENIITKLENTSGIQNCIYPEKVVKLVHKYFTFTISFILFLMLGLLVVVTILVFNTIRLTIHSRKEIIAIMRLVGATNWFIRSPFIIEGVVQGLVGGLIANFFVYIIVWFIRGTISSHLIVHREMYFVVLLFGILLGWFGSIISVNKYLKY